RKPWVRLRRVTEGWKVRFMADPKKEKSSNSEKPTISSNFCNLVKQLRVGSSSTVFLPVDNYPRDGVESRFTEVADNE
ncbi:MAG TPA: hypothetical protein VKZ70_08585, partial [Burkholderiaceae bacterium]|nr:hypothetical protein [Burkholderiaceae bacterium]